MIKCENCAMPKGTYENPGIEVEITRRAVNSFKRESHVTVWCCTQACAIMVQAQAEMGALSHKWPITLQQFASRLNRRKKGHQTAS